MERDKFIRREAKRAGMLPEKFLTFYEVLECDCGKRKCKGWLVKWKHFRRRMREAR